MGYAVPIKHAALHKGWEKKEKESTMQKPEAIESQYQGNKKKFPLIPADNTNAIQAMENLKQKQHILVLQYCSIHH